MKKRDRIIRRLRLACESLLEAHSHNYAPSWQRARTRAEKAITAAKKYESR